MKISIPERGIILVINVEVGIVYCCLTGKAQIKKLLIVDLMRKWNKDL